MRASTVSLALAWAIAIAGVAFGFLGWSRSHTGPLEKTPRTPGSQELNSLRLALKTSSAENQALRTELDRLREALHLDKSAGRGSGEGADANLQIPQALEREVANRLEELLAMAAAGDQAAKAEAGRAIFDLLRGGSAALTALRDVYVKTTDPQGRSLLLTSMVLSGAPQTRDFVFDQLQTEKDPDLRRKLTSQAAGYATDWQSAGNIKASFLDALNSSDDPATRAAAVRGLRHAPGGDAGSALQRAAADPSEEVRMAALEVIASRPGSEQLLRDLIARDPSARVREIGQCRLLIAQTNR